MCRAAAHSEVGKFGEAIADCEKAIQIDPSYSKAYSRLGWVYHAQGRFQEAIDMGFQKGTLNAWFVFCILDPARLVGFIGSLFLSWFVFLKGSVNATLVLLVSIWLKCNFVQLAALNLDPSNNTAKENLVVLISLHSSLDDASCCWNSRLIRASIVLTQFQVVYIIYEARIALNLMSVICCFLWPCLRLTNPNFHFQAAQQKLAEQHQHYHQDQQQGQNPFGQVRNLTVLEIAAEIVFVLHSIWLLPLSQLLCL